MSEPVAGWPSFRDFLVDLFGSLVPGILFIFMALVAISWSMRRLLRQIQAATDTGPVLIQVHQFAETFRFEILVFLIVASYVAGHFLFRQTPKEPDEASYHRISRHFTAEEHAGWVVQPEARV